MDGQTKRRLRDAALIYLYENGRAPSLSVPDEELRRYLGVSKLDFAEVQNLIMSQGMTQGVIVGLTTLSRDGQDEAERLGPRVLMKDPPPPTSVHIGVNYGIAQIGGAGSSQTASQTIDQSQVSVLLDQIEREIPTLSLPPAAKEEAKDALASLRKAAIEEGSKAGARMLAAGLSDLLRQGGSALCERLPELFKIIT